MNITLTASELHDLINPNAGRISDLEKECNKRAEEVQRLDGELCLLQDRNEELVEENWNLRQKQNNPLNVYSSQIAQVMIAVTRFFTMQKPSTAEALRHTLEELMPDQKILQIKTLREVTRAGLKEAKDFLEGTRDTLPSPIEDFRP